MKYRNVHFYLLTKESLVNDFMVLFEPIKTDFSSGLWILVDADLIFLSTETFVFIWVTFDTSISVIDSV